MNLRAVKKSETLRERALDALRTAILNGSVQPGTQLVEEQLAKQLGVSRGPVREAMRQLIEDGLLEGVPYRGTFVRSFTRRDIQEIYSFRTALERLAFELAWHRRDADFETELDKRHHELLEAISKRDRIEAIERELNLHALAYETAHHTLLMDSWNSLRRRLQYYFVLHQHAHKRMGSHESAHVDYVALAKGDDLDAMRREIQDHMQRGLAQVLEFVTLSSV